VIDEEAVMSEEEAPPNHGWLEITPAHHRQLAAQLFNETWAYLEKGDRTREDDDRMLHGAHASRHHWGLVGEPVNVAVGEWQCSRVYSVLGRAEPALHHARRCLQLAEQNELSDFHVGAAHEALARAHLVAGERDEGTRHAEAARRVCERLSDKEDHDILLADLATLPLA
jgi:hypothetical protein